MYVIAVPDVKGSLSSVVYLIVTPAVSHVIVTSRLGASVEHAAGEINSAPITGVGVGEGVIVAVAVVVPVGEAVDEAVEVAELLGVALAVADAVGVDVIVAVAVPVAEGEGIALADGAATVPQPFIEIQMAKNKIQIGIKKAKACFLIINLLKVNILSHRLMPH